MILIAGVKSVVMAVKENLQYVGGNHAQLKIVRTRINTNFVFSAKIILVKSFWNSKKQMT
jgi:hypothetical protein